jgi:hypothetical protein
VIELGPLRHDVSDFLALPRVLRWFAALREHERRHRLRLPRRLQRRDSPLETRRIGAEQTLREHRASLRYGVRER